MAQTPTPVPVLTWRYDQTHAGQNTSETALTTTNVNPSSFGKLFSVKVDSTVYPQPLYVPNLKMSDGQTHNVLFVETSNDSMYAFDADSNGGSNASPIWKVSLAATDHGAASGATAIPWQDTGSPDVAPTIGITGTPAIDSSTNTMYVVSNTKENGNYFARLHAFDITSGAERSGSPVEIKATVAGTGNGSSGGQLSFSPLWENQRPALALYNGFVYIGFAAHGDNGNWHGWLFSYNASTLAQKAVLCLSPNSYGAGIWASGAGLPIDNGASGGRMFIVTGNGPRTAPPFTASTSYGESVVAFSLANGNITPTDEFTPYNYQTLNNSDWDLGSGGMLMIPDQQGAHPHVALIAGKEGRITVLDRDNLGGFASGASSNTNALQDISGLIPQAKGFWSTAAYWNGQIYLWAENNVPMMFKMNTGVMDVEPDSKSPITSAWPSPTFSLSSNGTQNGIAWAVRSDQFNTNGPAVLYAWDANDLTKTIFESDTNAARDSAGPANRYSVPVVTNGKVYVAARGEIDVYGLLNGQQAAAAPVITPNGGTFSSTQSVTLSNTTASSSIYYTLDASTPTTSSTLYTAPITVSANTTVKAIASAPNYLQSSVSSAVFTFDTQTPTVTFAPAPATYTSAQTVTLSDSDANAKIFYTTDGTTPTGSSTSYTAPIQVSATQTIKAIAIDSTKQDSSIAVGTYTIQDGNSLDFSQGFSSTNGLTMNGSAVASNDTRLQLTNGGLNQAGSIFWSSPVNVQAFSTSFEFQISGDAQANGFTFCIQNDPHGVNALGGSASGLGYGGITKSVAVKFDFYDAMGSGSNSTGVYTNGDAPTTGYTDISPSGIQLNSGDSIQGQLNYDGTTLTLNLLDLVSNKTFTWSKAIDIPGTVGGNTAFVGFTGGTGGLSSSQKLLTWTYNVQAAPTQPAPTPSFAVTTSAVAAFKAGAPSTSTVTITPSGGFTGAVALACSVTSSPSGAQNAPTCTIDPTASVSGTQPATATLTIKTTAPTSTASSHLPKLFAAGGEALAAAVLLFAFPIRRRRWRSLIGALLFVFLLNAVTGCGGTNKPLNSGGGGGGTGTGGGGAVSPGTTPGSYTITVTGTSGASTASTTVNFTVQ
ncbi:chitobiase/beta-hexosaminidase C-terminal domain-containing protein [Occallatibacter savannae]|uniref:chitobiase/beta-hexosaminidase C-terminal domain-containing protein n=1 Tax=Occallatibacter savannae TaxID=1002691 RepID=UPI0013A59956|nr:chitobiase/beta-hexosaminidase C-terminal domain-containing protein [Occallatibacter savannae]